MPFLLLASSRLGLCLFPEWMDCVLVSAGSSGSPRPSACERACDLYSGPLPVSDQNTHTHIWANEQNKWRRNMLYPVGQQNYWLMSHFVKEAWNHQNAIPPPVPPIWLYTLLCGRAETVRLSIWPGGRFSITIMIIGITLVHKWAWLGPMASHDHPLSTLAHITKWFLLTGNGLCPHPSLCDTKRFCGSVTADTCRFRRFSWWLEFKWGLASRS